MIKLPAAISSFFKDRNGHVVLVQLPNIPLLGWLIFTGFSWLSAAGQLQHGFSLIGTGFLFTWAYLEIASGVSWFRRLLGLVVIGIICLGWLR